MDRNSNKWYGDDQIVIRGASIEDALVIMQIWNNNISNTFNTFNSRIKTEAEIIDKILESTKRRFGFFVSEYQGEVMGFATYFQFRNGVGYEKTLEHTIVISENKQRLGLGRALMKKILEDAQTKDFQSIFAGVSSLNNKAVKFHESLGFKVVAELPRVGYKFGTWLDLTLMQKFLQTD